MTDTTTLAPAAVWLRAADVIDRNGLACGDYVTPRDGCDPDTWPVCTMGAIAVACGLEPAVWEEWNGAVDEDGGFARAVEAVAQFAVHLGLDPEATFDETIGGWSDDQTAGEVVAALRAAAQEVPAP